MAPTSLPEAGEDKGPDVAFMFTIESPELGLDFFRTISMHVKEEASLHKMLAAALADMAAAVSTGGVLDSTQDRSVLELLERERLKGPHGGRVRQVSMYRLCQTCKGRLEPAAQRGLNVGAAQRSTATQTMNWDMECSSESDDDLNQISRSISHQVPDDVMHRQKSEQASIRASRPVEISIGQSSPQASWKRAAAESATDSCSGCIGQGKATGSPESVQQAASSQRSNDRVGTPVITPLSSQRPGEQLGTGIYSNTISSISTGSPSRGRTLDKVEKSPMYKKSPHCVELPSGMGLPVSLSSTLEAMDMGSDGESSRSGDADCPKGSGRSRPPLSSSHFDDQQSKKRPARQGVRRAAAAELASSMASTQATHAELTADEASSSGRHRKSGSACNSPETGAPHRRRSPMDDSFRGLAAEEHARTEVGLPGATQVRLSRSLDSGMRQAARDAFRAAHVGVNRKGSKGYAASRECSDRVRAACDTSDWKHAEKAEGLHNSTCRTTARLSQMIFSPDFPDMTPKILRRSSSARMASQKLCATEQAFGASRTLPSEAFRNTTASFERSDSARSHASFAQTWGNTMPPRLPSRSAQHSPPPPPDRDMVQGRAIKKWLERAGSPGSTIS
mmetsp:Transcript_157889/g.294515  ORF Transcript_157889/g.294515 Transcript_157889/m.294515 type:complete len:621 (-) Transcript_157889:86-1948(-)